MAQVTHRVASNGALGAGDYKYLHKDHLGSITAITYGGGTQKGQVFQRMAFDPWGARREISNNKVSAKLLPQTSVLATFAKTAKPITNRGFTGHEMLDEVGIIHMNGRIYDATIGRFLQADPTIDGATSVGGFNRYAYVKNNPLNAVDPTGYWSLSKSLKRMWNDIRPYVAAIVAIVATVTICGGNAVCGWEIYALIGGVSAAAGAAANGANLRQTLKAAAIGALSAAAFYGVSKLIPSSPTASANAIRVGKGMWMSTTNFAKLVVAQGMVGGAMSVLQGGKFGHGFVSAGFSKLTTPLVLDMGNTFAEGFASAMVGGTVSEMTGGKFANGATTAAFLYAFNALTSASEKLLRAQRNQFAIAAENSVGSTDWGFNDGTRGPKGTWKCNIFVGDTLSEFGQNNEYKRFSISRLSYVDNKLLAGQWGDSAFDTNGSTYGWQVVTSPERGDIFAYSANYSDASGHVGFYVGSGVGVWAGEYTVNTGVISNEFSDHKNEIIYRRYVGAP
ncbi:MAG: RHS repeat-associated core domain-containing protein [Marinagarivorans sp.]|nr:RHS repeat-associated core domain-containing protein [Marinagarivorans sp.]